jgi:hypothetical protein
VRRLVGVARWSAARPSLALMRRPEVRRLLVAVFGRPVRCARCGAVLFEGFAVVHPRGVTLVGTERTDVRVRFGGRNRLEFEHVYVGECAR